MAYTTINKSTVHFNTKLYTGTGSSQSITGVEFQPDWIWHKYRGGSGGHNLFDSVRGATKRLRSNTTGTEATGADTLTSFDSDGFSLGADTTGDGVNLSGYNNVSWNWKAGGTAPSKTYKVVVVSDSGNKFRFRNSADTATFGSSAVTLDLQEGGTYTFDGSDSTNSSHPFVLGTSSGVDGSYSTGVTYKLDGVTKTYSQYTSGYSSATSRQLIITVAASAPTLYYNCSVHSGMGGQINTNSTFGSSNFDGSIQTLVSENTTAGFSIVKYTGTGSNATIGHGLGAVPKWIITKRYDAASENWGVYHASLGNTKYMFLNKTNAENTSSGYWNNTTPTSSVFSIGTNDVVNTSSGVYIAYCFAEKNGYSKFGSYTGNGNGNGPFIYTGFKPAFLIVKKNATEDWLMFDNKRDTDNVVKEYLLPNTSGAANTGTEWFDFLSNGFKARVNSGGNNTSDGTYIYMAFGQTMVGSNNVTATAR